MQLTRQQLILVIGVVLLLIVATTTAVVVKVRMSALATFTVKGGVVVESPEQVASSYSAALGRAVPVDVAVLATCIASEEESQGDLVKTAVGWACLNEAGGSRDNVVDTLCPAGLLGSQNAGNHYASTARPATAADVAIAEGILNGQTPDPTGGATNFDSPKAQRAALARGTSKYTKTPEQVAANRASAGFQLVTLPGVDPESFRMWRRA